MLHGGNVWDGGDPGRWLDFSASLRPEGPPEWVEEALKDAMADVRYYPDWAMTAARQGIAAYLDLPEECVLPTAGGAAAIDLALSLRRGTVYVQPVTFSEYALRAAVHGRGTGHWDGRCGPGDTVVRCNPDNPTGHAAARTELLELSEQIARQGGELVVDEAFISFCPERTVCRDVGGGLTVTGSLTKTLCIPGVRLGYAAASPGAIARMEERLLPWSLSAFASAAAARLPEHKEEIRRDAAQNARRRAALAEALAGLGASVPPSEANFLLADFHRDMGAAVRALREEGILVRTCASFGLPENFLRLAVRTEEENERLIRVLRRLLEG